MAKDFAQIKQDIKSLETRRLGDRDTQKPDVYSLLESYVDSKHKESQSAISYLKSFVSTPTSTQTLEEITKRIKENKDSDALIALTFLAKNGYEEAKYILGTISSDIQNQAIQKYRPRIVGDIIEEIERDGNIMSKEEHDKKVLQENESQKMRASTTRQSESQQQSDQQLVSFIPSEQPSKMTAAQIIDLALRATSAELRFASNEILRKQEELNRAIYANPGDTGNIQFLSRLNIANNLVRGVQEIRQKNDQNAHRQQVEPLVENYLSEDARLVRAIAPSRPKSELVDRVSGTTMQPYSAQQQQQQGFPPQGLPAQAAFSQTTAGQEQAALAAALLNQQQQRLEQEQKELQGHKTDILRERSQSQGSSSLEQMLRQYEMQIREKNAEILRAKSGIDSKIKRETQIKDLLQQYPNEYQEKARRDVELKSLEHDRKELINIRDKASDQAWYYKVRCKIIKNQIALTSETDEGKNSMLQKDLKKNQEELEKATAKLQASYGIDASSLDGANLKNSTRNREIRNTTEEIQVYTTNGSFLASLIRVDEEEHKRFYADVINELSNSDRYPKIQPKIEQNATKYEHQGGALTQKDAGNGMFKFSPENNFTGVLTVERRDKQGNLLPHSKDIIEYKDGKPVAVIPGPEGESRVADFGAISKAAGVSVSSSVTTQAKSQGIDVASNSQRLAASLTIETLAPSQPPAKPRSQSNARGAS